jgi:hypothetical protein
MGLRQVKHALKKDETYIKFKRIQKYCGSLAEFDELVKEMENMHKSRKSRTLHLHKPKLDTLMEASMQSSAYRSRCVEIMNNVLKAQRLLQAATERIEAHIISNYKDQMGARSQGERKILVRSILESAYYKLADYERIIEMSKNLVEDIDQFSWTGKHILDALNILYTRESILGKR